jgi:methionyl-tRNA synthetase
MLKSAGYELPKTVYGHGFITLNGQKISKSLGNIIRPKELVARYKSADAIRYLLLRFKPLAEDGDITLEKFDTLYNADLANGLGNLVARIAKLCEKANFEPKNFDDTYYRSEQKEFHKLLNEYRFDQTLKFIWKKISQADHFIDEKKPWSLQGEKLDQVLEHLVKEIREIAKILSPFMPQTAEKIQKQFAGPKIKSEKPLFPRIK